MESRHGDPGPASTRRHGPVAASSWRALEALARSLVPPAVHVAVWTPARGRAELHPAEAANVAGAVARRREEFAAGRASARLALARLDIRDFPLLPGPDRAPRWPAGITGSISHCEGIAVACAARTRSVRGVGIDVESAAPLDERLRRRVLTAWELDHLPAPQAATGLDFAKLAFSAKESVYKCLSNRLERFLDFRDVEITWLPHQREFRASPVVGVWEGTRPLAGRFAVVGDLALTAVVEGRETPDPA